MERCSIGRCNHTGGTLPFSYHRLYTKLEEGDPRKISTEEVATLLRKRNEAIDELQGVLRRMLRDRDFDPSRKLSSKDNVRLVAEIVEELRPMLDRKRRSNPIQEAETYLRAALTTFVIKEQKAQKNDLKRQTQRDVIAETPEAMDEIVQTKSTQKELVRKQVSFFKKSFRSSRHARNQACNRTEANAANPQSARESFEENMDMDTAESPTTHSLVTKTDLLQPGNGQFRSLDDCITILTEQKVAARAHTQTITQVCKRLVSIRDEQKQTERYAATIDECNKILYKDIAELALGIARIQNVPNGHTQDLLEQLIKAGVTELLIDRLLINPEFDDMFCSATPNSKRSSDANSSIKIEDDG